MAAAGTGPSPSGEGSGPTFVDEVLSMLGHLLTWVARMTMSLWALWLPLVLVGVALRYRAEFALGPELAALPVTLIYLWLWRSGFLHHHLSAHRLRLHRHRAVHLVADGTLPAHRVKVRHGRVVALSAAARNGWDHARLVNATGALLAHYGVSQQARPVVTAARHGAIHVALHYDDPLPDSTTWSSAPRASVAAPVVIGQGLMGIITWAIRQVPHLLIIGATGSGKSVLGQSVIAQLLQRGWRIVAIDPKQLDMQWLVRHGIEPATRLADMELALQQAELEMVRRLNLCREGGVSALWDLPQPPPPLLVAVEEAAELLDISGKATTPEAKEDQAMRAECQRLITSIARLGRAADVHLLLMAQRPDASILGGQLRSNLRARVVVRDAGGPEALRMVEVPEDMVSQFLDQDRPPGRFVATLDGSTWAIGQAPYLSSEVLSSLQVPS